MNKGLENMRQVKAALLLRGWDWVAAWALANGFLSVTARRAIYDWWHRKDREPLGASTERSSQHYAPRSPSRSKGGQREHLAYPAKDRQPAAGWNADD